MEKIPGENFRLAGTLYGTVGGGIYITLLRSDQLASDKFWEFEKRIKQDKKCPGVLIELRKSSAIFDIARLIGDEVISLDDLDEFSDDLKEVVKFLIERW